MKKIKIHKKSFIIYSIILLVITIVLLLAFALVKHRRNSAFATLVLKNITIEVYQEVPKLEDYIVSIHNDNEEKYDLKRLKMKYVDENHKTISFKTETFECLQEPCSIQNGAVIATSVGTYYVNIYNEEDHIDELVQLNVIDNTAPSLSLKEYSIKEKETYQVSDFIDFCHDNSKEECKLSFIDNKIYTVPGIYEIIVIAKDSSGNQTEAKTKLTIESKNNSQGQTTRISRKGYSIVTKNGVTTIDGILIVNKTYSLPNNYGNGLTSITMDHFNTMKQAALNEGISLTIASGFRSYWTQNTLYNRYVSRDGKNQADTYSARPGHSEHQSGLAFDLNWVDDAFKDTKEGIWLYHNSYKYGFILRFPEGKTNETGYIYEPWHYRYVGVDLATKLYNNGDWITLEDFFGIDSNY